MSSTVKNIFRAVFFILVQVFVLNKIPPVHRFIIPYLYFLYILWLPFKTSPKSLLGISFIYGLALDYFCFTPGLHAAACVLVAYIRPYILTALLPKDNSNNNYEAPSPKSLGWVPYFTYVIIAAFAHHFYLTIMQWLSFGSFGYFVGKVISTTIISTVLILITELLFPRKQRYKTNR